MKQVLFALSLLALWHPIQAQVFPAAPVQDLHDRFRRSNRNAIATLGMWGAGNLLVSGILMQQHRGEERHFHLMNMGWGGVNLMIAGLGYRHYRRTPREAGTWDQVWKQQSDLQQVLALNTGLDLAYMAGGWWMQERGRHPGREDERLRGFGKSLILQGAFLFVFDLSLWIHHRKLSRSFLERWQLQPAGTGLGLTLHL